MAPSYYEPSPRVATLPHVMLEGFARKGRARIYQYWFDDAVVAMDLCIESGGQIVILKTAYDEAHKAVSPSTLTPVQRCRSLAYRYSSSSYPPAQHAKRARWN